MFQFGFNAYLQEINSRKQLSPQQQGHILSDIQQHQSRFQQHHQNLIKNQARHKDVDIVRSPPFSLNNFQQTPFQQQFSTLDLVNKQNLVDNTNVLLRQNQINALPNNFVNLNTRDPKIALDPQFNGDSFANNFGRQLPFIAEQNPTQLPFSRLEQPVLNQFSQPTVNTAQQLVNDPVINTNNFLGGNIPGRNLPVSNSGINQLPSQTILNLPTVQPTSFPQLRPILPPKPTQPAIPIDPEKQKEIQLKQQIIEKHNQFVEKQYEKALKKAQTDHQDWVLKQRDHKNTVYQTLASIENPRGYNYTQNRSRYPHANEYTDFQRALDKYFEEHPTTTTTTTTEATTTTTSPRNIFEKFKQQLLLANKQQKVTDIPIKITSIKSTTESLEDLISESVKDYSNVLNSKQKFLPTALPSMKIIPVEIIPKKHTPKVVEHKNNLLRQPKILLSENPELESSKNFTAREISLANFENLTLPNSNLLLGTSPVSALKLDKETLQKFILQSTPSTVKPPKAVLEELTKGVLPPGTDFEVIKHNQNGGLEDIGKLPSNLSGEKKVTFVLLEEQEDGSFKVQGVKGNAGEQNSKESVNVDSILKRIKNGEIKLPPSKNAAEQQSNTASDIETQSTISGSNSYRNLVTLKAENNVNKKTVSVTDVPTTPQAVKPTSSFLYSSQIPFSPSKKPYTSSTHFPSSTARNRFSSVTPSPTFSYTTTPKPQITTPFLRNTSTGFKEVVNLIDVLKKHELYAMAKFLKQSGLDTILNETGPYSVFVPTDKAFRLMLIQLGGPQKAEEKFKENPRLLSGVSNYLILMKL